jgi:hypothetical protein
VKNGINNNNNNVSVHFNVQGSNSEYVPEQNKTNFDILIAILREQNAVMQKNRNCVMMVLALLFPGYEIELTNNGIQLTKEGNVHTIVNENYEDFKRTVNKILVYGQGSDTKSDFNPSGEMAKRIHAKLQKRHQKLAEQQADTNKKIDIISRYISILTVAEAKDMNVFLQYTMYQLFDEFKRFELKTAYDMYIKAKLAGAQDLKEVED